MRKVWKSKRTQKKYWTEEEKRTVYEMAKKGTPVEEVFALMPARAPQNIKNKLNTMGYHISDGVLRMKK